MACVIVVGCYRTGSSAVAGVLHHLGVFMGDYFDVPSYANPKGYFEDLEFKKLHKLKETGELKLHKYQALIKKREERYSLWGIKDPLLCYYLDILVANLSCDSQVISCTRNTGEIINSLKQQLGEQDWETYIQRYLDAQNLQLANYHGHILYMDYSEIDLPEKFTKKIAEFVGCWPNKEAIDFLK